MKTPSVTIQKVHQEALLIVQKYTICEIELLEILGKSDQFKVH